MAVDWVQSFTWGPIRSTDGEQTHHARIPFQGTPNILATAYINAISSADVDEVVGAMATFERFEFMNREGIVREIVVTSPTAFIEVQRCVSITLEFVIRTAWAEAGWSVYFLS